jgi:hypothetical protein
VKIAICYCALDGLPSNEPDPDRRSGERPVIRPGLVVADPHPAFCVRSGLDVRFRSQQT